MFDEDVEVGLAAFRQRAQQQLAHRRALCRVRLGDVLHLVGVGFEVEEHLDRRTGPL